MMKQCEPKKSVRMLSGVAGMVLGLPLMGWGAEWSRFRGADGSGVAADGDPPVTWSDRENLKWTTAMPGPGSSSPIVWGELVFVTCFSGVGEGSGGDLAALKRHLVCVDRGTGKVKWDKAVGAEMPEDPYSGYLTEHGYASSTPATDGERVYVFYGKTGVLAYDFEGKELWRVNVGKESGNRRWGSAASLMLDGERVIVNASYVPSPVLLGGRLYAASDAGFAVCLDAADGKLIFRERLPGAASTGRGGKPFYCFETP